MTNNNSYGGGQNTYNPLKTKGKNKKIITIIIFLILIVVSISFAVFSPSINLLGRRNIKISKCELDINFKESDELMLVSKYPISKEEALKYDAKDITITNNSTCDTAYFKLTIKDLSNSSINKDKINYQLIDKSNNNEIADKNPDNFLVQDSLTKGNSKSYSIRIWIDERATNSDLYINGDTTKPIEYKYALNIEATDKKPKEDYALEFAQAKVGTDGLEQITHTIDDTLQVDSKFTTEYRYRGGDSVVKNYVTFNNETWRIIGIIPTEDTSGNVENRFKIIRNEYIKKAAWNSSQDANTNSYNNWVTADLNTYLNNDYYNTLNDEAKSMIGTTKYYLGGYNTSQITTNVMWQYERKNDVNRTDYYYGTNPIMQNDDSKKIAIMYASDYGYAASKECTQTLYDYGATGDEAVKCRMDNNWLNSNYYTYETWLLTQNCSNYSYVFYESNYGKVEYIAGAHLNSKAVIPVLTLSSNVKIASGTATSSDPYQLNLE